MSNFPCASQNKNTAEKYTRTQVLLNLGLFNGSLSARVQQNSQDLLLRPHLRRSWRSHRRRAQSGYVAGITLIPLKVTFAVFRITMPDPRSPYAVLNKNVVFARFLYSIHLHDFQSNSFADGSVRRSDD